MRYLEFYNRCMKRGKIPQYGLCNCMILEDDGFIDLFRPPYDYGLWLWGYSGEHPTTESAIERATKFTPMRQTIVLFMAAMNNEL